MQLAARGEGKVGRLPVKVAGGLAYLTFIPAIIFLLLEPYKTNRYVRFHSFQCLLFSGAVVALAAALRLAGLALFIIPVLGPLLMVLVDVVAALAAIFIWLVLLVKALQGEMFRLPVLGGIAVRYAETA
jgi:uncharacterized membrane protein